MSRTMKVNAECADCNGTGVYQGMCESPGTAVVCLSCNGTGCYEMSYIPFERRKGRRGIEKVYRSRGAFIATGVGKTGEYVTYKEFQQGKMPGE